MASPVSSTLLILLLLQAPMALAAARQVTHGNDSDPSFAPDGHRMVVVTTIAGKEQLSVLNVDGTHRMVLTNSAQDHEDPAWSPDGHHIAYVLIANGSEVIHLMEPDGSHDYALTPSTQKTIHPTWARDSSHVLYCTDDDLRPPLKNSAEIYSIDVATRKTTPIIAGGINTYPHLSPDGAHIAFRRMLGQHDSEVFVAESNGRNARNLTNNPAFDGWPDWSPDGTRIAFASNRNGDRSNYRIYVMRADGSDVRLLADTPGRGTAPHWLPNGEEVFFTICQREGAGSHCEIYTNPSPGN